MIEFIRDQNKNTNKKWTAGHLVTPFSDAHSYVLFYLNPEIH